MSKIKSRVTTSDGRERGLPRSDAAVMTALIVLAVTLVGASSALAVVVRLRDGAAVSYQPIVSHQSTFSGLAASPPPLEYRGGAVMSSNTNYLIVWKAPKVKFAAHYVAGVNAYMKNLAHDSGKTTNVDSLLEQYGANYASAVGGTIIDKDPLPASGCMRAPVCLTNEQLTAEIKKVVESKGLPRDLTHEYFLLTGEGVESCFDSGGHACSANAKEYGVYCAYHGYISTPSGPIIFSNDPYVYNKACDSPEDHPNGPGDAALLGGLSHEHSESVTDPELNAWINEYGQEVGDLCRTFEPESEFGPLLGTTIGGSPYNQVVNKHFYFYQQEWSNEANGCRQRG